MLINGKYGSPPIETPTAKGITVSVKKAAEILGVSSATLKRKASEWGLTTFWDGRGRRFSTRELKEAQEGLLEPKKQIATQDLDVLYAYEMPGGYRFRVYRTGEDKGYVGFFVFEDLQYVRTTLRNDLGHGVYYLKLLDEHNRMTGLNFSLSIISDPSDDDRAEKLEELRELKTTIRSAKDPGEFMARRLFQAIESEEGE